MPTKSALKWTCDGCSVTVSRIDGQRAPIPEAWATGPEGQLCLGCRRQRAAEAALEQAPTDTARSERVKVRRAGLIEFELRRTPGLSDSSIARACRSSVAAVAATRRRVDLKGADR
jgi:hypothetical protein